MNGPCWSSTFLLSAVPFWADAPKSLQRTVGERINFGGAIAKIQREIAGINAAARKPGEDLAEAVRKADAEFQQLNIELAKDILTPDANVLTGEGKIKRPIASADKRPWMKRGPQRRVPAL